MFIMALPFVLALPAYAPGRSGEGLWRIVAPSHVPIDICSGRQPLAHIHSMARMGRLEEVAECLAEGADPNAVSIHGATPLFLAARAGHTLVVELLLRAGADLNRTNEKGETPLCEAVGSDWIDVIALLLAAGANPNISRGPWGPPVAHAGMRNRRDIVQMLMDAGADPEVRGHQNMAAAEWLAVGGLFWAGQGPRGKVLWQTG